MINARKLGYPADLIKKTPVREQFNVFSGFFNNYLFVGILIGCFAIQFAIVYLGGKFLRVDPLKWQYQLYALGLSLTMLPWNLITKLVPSSCFKCCSGKDKVDDSSDSKALVFSRSMREYSLKKIKQEQR